MKSVLTKWRKSSFSGPQGGNCVEASVPAGGSFAGIRDTKQPDAGTIVVPSGSWAAFVNQVCN